MGDVSYETFYINNSMAKKINILKILTEKSAIPHNIINFRGDIDTPLYTRTLARLRQIIIGLETLKKTPPKNLDIYVFICSEGGDIGQTYALCTVMNHIRAEYPFVSFIAIIEDACMSSAFVLASTCDVRYAYEHAMFLNHGSRGDYESTLTSDDLANEKKAMDNYDKLWTKYFHSATQVEISEDYLSTQEIKKLGWLDGIIKIFP